MKTKLDTPTPSLPPLEGEGEGWFICVLKQIRMRLTCLGSISLNALSSKKGELFRVKLPYFIHNDEDPEWETIPHHWKPNACERFPLRVDFRTLI
jgi:hypothetical protein